MSSALHKENEMSIEAIIIIVLLGLLDVVLFMACFALEEREDDDEQID